MELFHFDPGMFLSFLLVFIRVSMVLFLLPFIGGTGLPTMAKAALCIVITLAIWPEVKFSPDYFPTNVLSLGLTFLGELLLGLIVSIIIRSIFSAVQTAGEIIGFQMGFSMMNIIDPLSGGSVSLISQFLYIVAILIFLTLNGHIFLIKVFLESFKYIPPGTFLINHTVFDNILFYSSQIFVMAVKIAAPVMAIELLISFSFAIIARIAPQINILFVGFPIKIAVGLFFLGILFNLIVYFLKHAMIDLNQTFLSIYTSLR